VLDALNDEKRELIMKNTAAASDVQKAEQRAWEREQENGRLKSEITSLQLRLARTEFAHEHERQDLPLDGKTPRDSSFLTAKEDFRSPDHVDVGSPHKVEAKELNRSPLLSARLSPSLDRAVRQMAEQEFNLRKRICSLTGSPAQPTGRPPRLLSPLDTSQPRASPPVALALTPTSRHEQLANQRRDTDHARMSSEVRRLGLREASVRKPQTIVDVTQVDDNTARESEERPECQQS
jgi:hypothetical protein